MSDILHNMLGNTGNNSKRKILHVIESFAAGSMYSVSLLVSALEEYHHIVVWGKREHTPSDFERYFPDGTEFISWRFVRKNISPFFDVLATVELMKILRSIRPSVVHLHSSKAGFLGRIAARLLGMQDIVVYTARGASFLRKDISEATRLLFVLAEKLGYRMGGCVVGCSLSETEEFLKLGIDAKCIYNSVPESKLNPSFRDKLPYRIGTVGRITAAKNPDLFARIAERFTEDKDIEFVWVGDGELRNRLVCRKKITVTGWIDFDEVEEYIASFDVYLSTSLWEGLSLSVLQAMQLGRPLVLSRCVGNIDLIIEGYNGYIYDSVDEAEQYIRKLIEQDSLRYNLGEGSRKLFKERFSVDKMADTYNSLYRDLIKDSRMG